MQTDEIRDRVRMFLSRSFPQREIRDDEDVFASGFINSLFAMELVEFVEAQFQIAVQSEDLEMANFQSVDAITGLISRKRGDAERSSFV